MITQELRDILLRSVTPIQWYGITHGWVNDVSCEDCAKETGVPLEVVRGIYFASDLVFYQNNQHQWFSQWEAKTHG